MNATPGTTPDWNWMHERGETEEWPPPAEAEYDAVVLDSPCGDNFDQLDFDVLLGEANEDDSTAPDSVQFTVTNEDASNSWPKSNGTDWTVEIEPEQTTSIQVEGFDRDGLQALELVDLFGYYVNGQKETSFAPGQGAIPQRLDFSTSTVKLSPYDVVKLEAKATNYSGMQSSSGRLIMNVKHMIPDLTSVTTDQGSQTISPGEAFDINGYYLASARGIDTKVHFWTPDGSRSAYTSSFSSVSAEELSGVVVPQAAFSGYSGPINFRVITAQQNGSVEKQSDDFGTVLDYDGNPCATSGTTTYYAAEFDDGTNNQGVYRKKPAKAPSEACSNEVEIKKLRNPGYNGGCAIIVRRHEGVSSVNTGWIYNPNDPNRQTDGTEPTEVSGNGYTLNDNTYLTITTNAYDNDCTPPTTAQVEIDWEVVP